MGLSLHLVEKNCLFHTINIVEVHFLYSMIKIDYSILNIHFKYIQSERGYSVVEGMGTSFWKAYTWVHSKTPHRLGQVYTYSGDLCLQHSREKAEVISWTECELYTC